MVVAVAGKGLCKEVRPHDNLVAVLEHISEAVFCHGRCHNLWNGGHDVAVTEHASVTILGHGGGREDGRRGLEIVAIPKHVPARAFSDGGRADFR